MYLHEQFNPARDRRRHPRLTCDEVQCRAVIHLGRRVYAGYLHKICEGGAKLRTISSIGKPGELILRLPDLPPLRCELHWSDFYNAGVGFAVELPRQEISLWLTQRMAMTADCARQSEVAYMERAD